MERLVVAAAAALLVALVCGATAWAVVTFGQGRMNWWLAGGLAAGGASLVLIAWWVVRKGEGKRR